MYFAWWRFCLVYCRIDVNCFQFLFSFIGCCVWSSILGIFLVLSWWPISVGIEWVRHFWMLLSFMNLHVDRLLFPMAFIGVLVVGLTIDWCRKVRVSFMVPYGRTAFIFGSPFGMHGWGLGALVDLHSLVAVSLYPVKILSPPFDTCTRCFVNVNSHPLSHSTIIVKMRSLHIFEFICLLWVLWRSVHFHLSLNVCFNFIPVC